MKLQRRFPQIEKQILSELISGVSDKKPKQLSFNNLVSKYLEYDWYDWVSSTRKRNKELLNKYLIKAFSDNFTTKGIIIRVINVCNIWGFKHVIINKPIKKKGGASEKQGTKSSVNSELKILIDEMIGNRFNMFVRFAYCTCAKSGEIRFLSDGKSSINILRLNLA